MYCFHHLPYWTLAVEQTSARIKLIFSLQYLDQLLEADIDLTNIIFCVQISYHFSAQYILGYFISC